MTAMRHRTMAEQAAAARRGRTRQLTAIALIALCIGLALGYWWAR
jgi:hypothetical protein